MLGDCLERLRELPDSSVDSVVTDPPYGLSFMGKKWDYDVPSVEVWAECLRVLKPGGHLLAFAGTRTQHRMAVRIEDAGFEIRDMIAWVYGSGFPKSLDVSKAIDKAAGFQGRVVGRGTSWNRPNNVEGDTARMNASLGEYNIKELSPTAQQWQGWGTALKPALEPITVARKPLGEKTVAANVLEHGTGAINVDGCRVETEPPAARNAPKKIIRGGKFHASADAEREMSHYNPTQGRWPANFCHDGSDEVVGLFPVTTSGKPCGKRNATTGFSTGITPGATDLTGFGDTGSAARFFYCAKASKKDRDEGCEGMEYREAKRTQAGGDDTRGRPTPINRNFHPTVKPTALMRYLCRLVTPPGGVVLDPFMGSGSTGKAAISEGFQFVGIEREEEYMKIAESRIAAATIEHA